jgi:hypothetical protein
MSSLVVPRVIRVQATLRGAACLRVVPARDTGGLLSAVLRDLS